MRAALVAEARDALERINTNAFDHDLLFQYRGGVLGRELTLIVRDLADALEAATRERDAATGRFECDRECIKERAPIEDCSAHGRTPRDLWGQIDEARKAAYTALTERDAAVAAVERVRANHQIDDYTAGHTIVRCVCEEIWPCSTIQALDGAPEPEVAELPETGLEVRDGDGDLVMSGEHRKVLHQGGYVCDTCVNILGINVRWDRAGLMEGHPLPVEGEGK